MKQFSGLVQRVSGFMDKLAGVFIFSVMLLIVTNIILRAAFKHPILGTYEIVGFLAAMGVSLGLAHCALREGHIAVSFVMERFSPKVQAVVNVVVNTVSIVFWTAAVWYIGKYALAMKTKGLVSSTAEIPVYPFIYMVALGVLGLCLVLLFKLLVSLRDVLKQGY